jgi:hypothetical protein
VTIKCVPQQILLSGFGGRKGPSSMGKISTAEVLRLRATSAVSRDKSATRSAQDDDFVGILRKNIQSKLALMGLCPGLILRRPCGAHSGEWWAFTLALQPMGHLRREAIVCWAASSIRSPERK